jgi:tetratricopeptide (TPR) repeat protein
VIPGPVKLPHLIGAHLTSARAILWGAALAILGGALCFVPLLNLLSYEFSFVVGLVAACGAAYLAVQLVARARAAAEITTPWHLYGWALATNLALLLCVPLLLITLNAVRVKVCDYRAGLAFYLLLPVLSVAVASAVGVAAGLAVPRRGRAVAVALGVIAASVGVALYRFWAAPPIFAYDPFGGYFPGALYDEDLRLEAPLLWARLQHVAGALALLCGVAALADHHELRLRLGLLRAPHRRGAVAACLAALAVAALLYALGPRLGFRQDAASIARELGGRRETAHFTIIYPKVGDAARTIDLIVEDHEVSYAQLSRTLGVAPPRITSFVFASAEQKRRLMGAARVELAKPWRREIYIRHERYPHPVVRHELAHVFAGEFAGGPFQVPTRPSFFGRERRPFVNVGLLEGVAEAASWAGGGRLTPHQWARTLDELKLRPRLRQVFSLGFFGDSAPRSYTLAGSFCRWLLETRGPAPLRAVYRSGGDFTAAYGRDLDALEAEWLAWLRRQPLVAEDLELARDHFLRPSIFRVPCAHAVAARRRKADGLFRGGAKEEAIAQLRQVCRDDPGDPEGPLDLAVALGSAGDPAAARRAFDELLARKLPGATRARVESSLADFLLRTGRDLEARAALNALLALPTDDGLKRITTARLMALDNPRLGAQLRPALVPEPDGTDAALLLLRLREVVTAAPHEGLGPYLLGRQLYARGRPKEALPWLRQATVLPLPDQRFARENQRILGHAAHEAGDSALAGAVFRGLRDAEGTPEALRLEAVDMLERIVFDRTSGLGPRPAPRPGAPASAPAP